MLLHPFQKSCLLEDGFVLWEIQTTKYVSLFFFFFFSPAKNTNFPARSLTAARNISLHGLGVSFWF